MKKITYQFFTLAALFFGIWLLLSRIDFVKDFHIVQITKANERKLGDLILRDVKQNTGELESDSVKIFINGIKKRLCTANGIKDSSITIDIFLNEDVNAFALPGNHIIVYSALIEYCKNPEELCGVLAHEIAHIKHGDVIKKLTREIGFSMLTTIAGGNAGGQISRDVIKLLSSTAFDREQEEEADTAAVRMMANANIDPEYFADLLFRLSKEKNDVPKRLEWISTHPNSQDRSAEVLNLRKHFVFHSIPIASNIDWKNIENIISEEKRN